MRIDNSINPRRCSLILMGLILALIVCGTRGARAQVAEWQEQRTANFAILFPGGSEAEAAQYAQFVDGVYDEVSAVFSYRTPPPVILRIYPTMELYEKVNPLAASIPGVVAHAHTGRREISIALPQTADQSQEQIINNVRHELTHIIAADLSGDKLTTAFQEGIAQYLEHPSSELDVKMQLMQQVIDADRVLSWRELNQPGTAYANPQISYPQSYTMVAFLIQRDGFATFRRFIEASKTSSGYRSALETAYGVSPDQLEKEWLAQLEAFVAGEYRNRAIGAFDLSQAEALIARGEYEAAIKALELGLNTLQDSGPADLAERARQLLRHATNGQRATKLAADARSALERSEYAAAKSAADEGRRLFAGLGQPEQMKVMEEYSTIADEGLAAQREMTVASGELQTLHINAARNRLAAAYQTFTRLGDESGAASAESALLTIQRTETAVAVGLVILGALVLGWNIHRRVNERDHALPFG
ncbi:MAG TPA: peptidase MA family metallohydrolase [Herpetosiphonaceae bacterium]